MSERAVPTEPLTAEESPCGDWWDKPTPWVQPTELDEWDKLICEGCGHEISNGSVSRLINEARRQEKRLIADARRVQEVEGENERLRGLLDDCTLGAEGMQQAQCERIAELKAENADLRERLPPPNNPAAVPEGR